MLLSDNNIWCILLYFRNFKGLKVPSSTVVHDSNFRSVASSLVLNLLKYNSYTRIMFVAYSYKNQSICVYQDILIHDMQETTNFIGIDYI